MMNIGAPSRRFKSVPRAMFFAVCEKFEDNKTFDNIVEFTQVHRVDEITNVLIMGMGCNLWDKLLSQSTLLYHKESFNRRG